MMYGYARVSRPDQKIDLQISALLDYGVELGNIYWEAASGKNMDREKLQTVLMLLREGDKLVIWHIDRLTRSAADFIKIREDLLKREIELVIITLPIDFKTPIGKLLCLTHVGNAEYERDRLVERTIAGLEAAAKRGKFPGRRKGQTDLTDSKIAEMLQEYLEQPETPVRAIAKKYGISYQTLNNLRAKAGIPKRKRGRTRQKT